MWLDFKMDGDGISLLRFKVSYIMPVTYVYLLHFATVHRRCILLFLLLTRTYKPTRVLKPINLSVKILWRRMHISAVFYSIRIRDETILLYIDILQYFLLQYNTIHLKKISIYCTLQYIAMFVVFKVLNFQLLHSKNDWTSCNLECTVQLLTILDGFSFLLLLKNHISIWNVLVP